MCSLGFQNWVIEGPGLANTILVRKWNWNIGHIFSCYVLLGCVMKPYVFHYLYVFSCDNNYKDLLNLGFYKSKYYIC